MELNKTYEGDALALLRTFPSEIFNTCVTSPPYYGLRAYGTNPVIWDGDENCQHEWIDATYVRNNDKTAGAKQKTNVGAIGRDAPIKNDFCSKCGAWRGELGSEPSPELFIKHLVDIFREAKRTLRDDGTLWVNMGDSYCANTTGSQGNGKSTLQGGKSTQIEAGKRPNNKTGNGLKPKDLIGIPWMLAFALRADGWYLRMDNIWYKRNPMPESVTDRPTKAHEYFFLLSKSQKYYYDAEAIKTEVIPHSPNESHFSDGTKKDVLIRQRGYKTPDGWDTAPGSHGTIHREGREKGFKGYVPKRNPRPGIDTNGGNQGNGGIPIKGYEHRGSGDKTLTGHSGNFDSAGNLIGDGKANKRSVWDVPTKPFKEAHFATFPEELIVDCIKAGCPEGGLVLDPFGGANTTGVVSRKLNRNYVAIELNPKYIKIGEKREYEQIGLFK